RRLSTARAGLEHAVTTAPGWNEIAATARTLPDDAQGVYLLLARTALAAAPCPPDAVLARVYGTHSPARARRVLSFLEQQGVIVLCPEAHDWRAVALPGLGWRTAPGNPAAPDLEAAY
ncbi:MAG: ATP-binding protein, partial [Pseudomonadota bacterium]|nr:ATP-binding protein [Pseudomonadota bacterium]